MSRRAQLGGDCDSSSASTESRAAQRPVQMEWRTRIRAARALIARGVPPRGSNMLILGVGALMLILSVGCLF
eukprot:14493530-Alexandrium_andersonii.AAC.1